MSCPEPVPIHMPFEHVPLDASPLHPYHTRLTPAQRVHPEVLDHSVQPERL